MRIERIQLVSFGGRSGLTLGGLKPGTNIIYGLNETGKTTLMEAVRAVLFGFLDGRQKTRNRFELPTGADRHVNMILSSENGMQWQLDRTDGKGGLRILDLANGSEVPMSRLTEALHHTERTLYENIFAFSLDELSDFQSLQSPAVHDRLMGAALGGGAASPSKAIQTLRVQRDSLFKARGSKNRVATAKRLLKDAQARIGELRERPAEYDETIARLSQARNRRAEIQKQRSIVEEQLDQTRRLLACRQTWDDRVAAALEAAQLKHAAHMPPDAAGQLNSALDRKEEAETELEDLERQLQHLEGELAAFEQPDDLEAFLPQLDRFLSEGSAQANFPKAISQARQQLADAERAVKDCRGKCGDDWNEERVNNLPASRQLRSEALRLWQSTEDARRSLESSKDKLESIELETRRLEGELDAGCTRMESLKHLKAVPPDASERVSRLNGEIEAAEAKHHMEAEEATRKHAKADEIVVNEDLANALPQVSDARANLREDARTWDEIARLIAELDEATQQTAPLAAQCGPGWTEERILRAAESSELATRIGEWQLDLGKALTAEETASAALDEAKELLLAEEQAFDARWTEYEIPEREQKIQHELDRQTEGLQRFRTAVEALHISRAREEEAQLALTQENQAATQKQRDLSVPWDPERIAAAQTDGGTLDEIHAWSQRLSSAAQDVQWARHEQARAAQRFEQTKEAVAKLEATVENASTGPTIDPALAPRIRRWLDKERDLEHARERSKSLSAELQSLVTELDDGVSSVLPLWVLWITGAIGAVVVAGLVVASQAVAAVVVGVVLVLLLGLLAMQRSRVRQQERASEDSRRSRIEGVEQQLADCDAKVKQLAEELAGLGRQMPAQLVAEREPLQRELERIESQLFGAQQQQQAAHRLESLRQQLEQEQHDHNLCAGRSDEKQKACEAMRKQWQAWVTARLSVDDTDPNQAAALVHEVREAQAALKIADDARDAHTRATRELHSAQDIVTGLLRDFEHDADLDTDGAHEVLNRWTKDVQGLDVSLAALETLRRYDRRVQAASATLQARRTHREQMESDWCKWIETQGFRADETPPEAHQRLSTIKTAADAIRSSTRKREALVAMQNRWESRCSERLQEVGLEPPPDLTLEAVTELVERLYSQCEVAHSAATQRTSCQRKAEEAAERAKHAKRQIDELTRRRDGHLAEWGFDSVIQFNAARNDLVEYTELARSLPSRQRDLQSTQEREESAAAKVVEETERVRTAESALAEFAQRNRLPAGLDREGLTDLIDAIGDYRAAIDNLVSVREATERRLARWDKMLERYRPLLDATGLSAEIQDAEPPEIIDRISRSVDRLKSVRQLTEKSHQKRQELAALKNRLENLQLEVENRDAAVRGLLEKVGASSQDEYRHWCADAERYREVQQTIAEKSAAIGAALGTQDLDALTDRLQSTDWTLEAANVRTLDESLAAFETELHELSERIGADETRQAQLEQSDELAEHRQAEATAQAQLEQAAEEWLVWAAAVEILERARERYERERQPEVLLRASDYFSTLTGGAYERIYVRLGEQEMQAVRADGTHVPLLHLSRGTVEPLYLALRLALIDDFARDGRGAPPVLMDDILVNFDDTRAQSAAAAVNQLGERVQVLLLTCHKRTIDNFKGLSGGVNVLELNQ